MREPKFSDAACFGNEFDETTKVCYVCLASSLCQVKSKTKIVQPVRPVTSGRVLYLQASRARRPVERVS